jgi:hypothetical protein
VLVALLSSVPPSPVSLSSPRLPVDPLPTLSPESVSLIAARTGRAATARAAEAGTGPAARAVIEWATASAAVTGRPIRATVSATVSSAVAACAATTRAAVERTLAARAAVAGWAVRPTISATVGSAVAAKTRAVSVDVVVAQAHVATALHH